MKFSIIYNKNQKQEKDSYVEIHYSDINRLDDAIATEIKIIDTIDYIENPELLINDIIKKMRYGCLLTILATDVLCIADKILCGNSNINEIRLSLYYGKKSISHYEHIKNILEQQGLIIDLINLDKQTNKYLILARKPDVR